MKLTVASAAALVAAVAGMTAAHKQPAIARPIRSSLRRTLYADDPPPAARSRSRRYPSMVTSSNADIAEHNRNVATRQVLRRSNLRDFKLRRAGRRAAGQL